MYLPTGYQILAQLHESENSYVYRARRNADGLPVVLKLLRESYPPLERVAWFRREYEITRSLNLAGVVKATALARCRGTG